VVLRRGRSEASISGLLFFQKRPFPGVVEHEMIEIAKQATGTKCCEPAASDFSHKIKFLIIVQTEIATALFGSHNFEFTGFHIQ